MSTTALDIPSLSNGELQEQLAHAHDNKAPQLIATTVAFIIISTVSVGLRVTSRRIQGLKLGADDYAIFVSLALAFGMFVNIVYGVRYGLGKHVIFAGLTNGEKAAKTLYVFEILFPASNAAVKISTLFLYRRIFGNTHSRFFFASIYLLGALWTALFVVGTCCTVFQCGIQFSLAWTTFHSQGCLNITKMIYALTVISVILNGFTLIVPIPFIHNLKLSPWTKMGLLAVFAIGCGDISISVARAVESARINLTSLDFTWRLTGSLLLAFSEVCVGITGTCFVLMRPIYLRCHALATTRKVTRRFPLSSETSQGANYDKSGLFTVPIFLRTRQKWSTLAHSFRTGLSGATIVLRSRQDGGDVLEEWELKPGQDRVQSTASNPGILTHPWKMNTFDSVESSSGAGGSPNNVTFSQYAHVKQQGNSVLILDKPLPPLPDDVSSLSCD